MRIAEIFAVERAPAVVFDFVTDPANLATWQTSKTAVEALTDGPPGLGTRVRERTKPPGAREFEQVVEFTEFDRPAASTRTFSRARTRSTERGPSSPTARGRACDSSPRAPCAG